MSEKISRINQVVKMLGLVFVILGGLLLYNVYSTPDVGSADSILFHFVGGGQILLGFFILFVKVSD